jgi:holo-[acyl-carrier protein] synthase
MPVVALGMDLVQIKRLEAVLARRGQRFVERVFTPAERRYCESRARPATHFAGRFAVKEAVMKALGTGWARGVRWRDIEVRRGGSGPPELVLHGATAGIARQRSIERIHITITHDAGLAAAVAVAESASGASGA